MNKLTQIALLTIGFIFSIETIAQVKLTKVNVKNDTDFTGFSLLDTLVKKEHAVFFTGENHTFRQSNSDIELKMFKYLNQKHKVKNLIMEFGYSHGWLVNEYIQTGDTNLFNTIKLYAFKSYTQFYKDLYEYNKTLATNEKLHIYGIDVERFFEIPVKVASIMLPQNQDAPEEIRLHVEALKALVKYNDVSMKETQEEFYVEETDEPKDRIKRSQYEPKRYYSEKYTLEEILKNFKENKTVYQKYIGDKFKIFETIMLTLEDKNTYAKYEDNETTHGYVYREQYMYKEMLKLITANPTEKYYGQFGRCHVSTKNQEEACGWYDFNAIATRLNTSSNTLLKNKVFSIAILYAKSNSDKNAHHFDEFEHYTSSIQEIDSTMYFAQIDTSHKELKSRYNLIIINNSKPGQNIEEGMEEVPYDLDNIGYRRRRGGFLIELAQDNVNLNSINQFLTNATNSNVLNFQNQKLRWGFGMSFFKNKGVVFDFSAGAWIAQKNNNSNNNSTAKLTGTDFSLSLGKDLIGKDKIVLAPIIGIGYQNLTLEYKAPNTTVQQGLMQELPVYTYTNSCYYLLPKLEFRYILSKYTLGMWCGYKFDFSNPYWENVDGTLKSGAKTSTSGLSFGLKLIIGD